MSVSGLQYLMGVYGVDTDAFKVIYDFETSGSLANNATRFTGQYSGVLYGDANTFWQESGRATFSNHAVELTGLPALSDFAVFMWGQRRTASHGEVLFSSLESGISGITSGVHVYVNDVNRLSFTFRTCSGCQGYSSNISVLGDYVLGVSHYQGKLDFYSYDYATNSLINNTLQVLKADELFPSNKFYIGQNSGYTTNVESRPYSGNLDTFLFSAKGCDSSTASLIFSGLFANIIISSTPWQTGSPCTGVCILPTVVYTQSGDAVPSGLLQEYGILITSQTITPTDVVLYDVSISGTTNFNNSTSYSQSENNSIMLEQNPGNVALYLNGQRLISGQTAITGSFCGRAKYYPYDFDVTGRMVDDAGNVAMNDTVWYDRQDVHLTPQIAVATGTGAITVAANSGIACYINGVRVHEFTLSGTQLTPPSYVSTDLVSLDYLYSGAMLINQTGQGNIIWVSGGFIQNSSRVYLNGQRLKLGTDYLEIGSGEFSSIALGNIPTQKVFETLSVDQTYNI